MKSVKVKYRPSKVENKKGLLYYQFTHGGVIKQIKTSYKLSLDEWDNYCSDTIKPSASEEMNSFILSLKTQTLLDVRRINRINTTLLQRNISYSAEDIVNAFYNNVTNQTLFSFMKITIIKLKDLGRSRTAETYISTLNSFMRFKKDVDILLYEVDSYLMQTYEAYLKGNGIAMNTISFYMRILRAVYNRAVDQDITEQHYPFKHVYTGVDKTLKRAVSLKTIKQIKELDLSNDSKLELIRDLFIFSFYTRGMSFVDMSYLKKKNLNNGVLSYRRRKTNQQLNIKWEKCMQEIIDKYQNNNTQYLLPIIINPNKDDRTQYQNTINTANRKLKKIAKLVNLPMPLTMYVSRHSWASIAKSKNIPISVISEGMGHNSEGITQIYLASMDTAIVDKANRLLINSL